MRSDYGKYTDYNSSPRTLPRACFTTIRYHTVNFVLLPGYMSIVYRFACLAASNWRWIFVDGPSTVGFSAAGIVHPHLVGVHQ